MNVFDPHSLWVTRNNCGFFPWWLIAVYAAANVAIWLAYESIPFTLNSLARRGFRVFDDDTTRLFSIFIRACGRGHLLENVLVWVWPHYGIFAGWHVFTATVSVYTAFALMGLRNTLVSEQDRDAVAALKDGVTNLANKNDANHSSVEAELERLKIIATQIEFIECRERASA